MRSIRFSILIFFTVVTATACNNHEHSSNNATAGSRNSEPSILLFDKLTGTWLMDDGHTYERWTKESNSQFRSEVFTINSGDTIWKEQADVFQENEQWIFQNTVKDQNDGKAIRFTSTVWNDSMVQFSNTRHDFPQQIRYLLKNNNTIHAYIAGPNNKGGMDTIPFNYTRYR